MDHFKVKEFALDNHEGYNTFSGLNTPSEPISPYAKMRSELAARNTRLSRQRKHCNLATKFS
jgi:hypothetical protein